MKRVLFSMVLLMAVSFAFAQEKNVKEAKSIAGEVKPDFACGNLGRSRLYSEKNQRKGDGKCLSEKTL